MIFICFSSRIIIILINIYLVINYPCFFNSIELKEQFIKDINLI